MQIVRFRVMLLLSVFLFASCGASPAKKPTIDKSASMQAQRQKLIDQFISQGFFTEVVKQGNGMPRVWVTPRFTASNLKDKQNALSVVYAFYFDGSETFASLALIDSRTGKEVGRFDKDGIR